jgi:Ni/Co efflux regulator RcnB
MVRFMTCVAAAVVVVGALAACKSGSKTPAPEQTPVIRNLDFSDIPVPRDFALQNSKSAVVQNHSFRNGRLVYVGRARMETLRDWYKKAMIAPPSGWTQVPPPSGETGVGPYTLRFEKGVEVCEILIEAPKDETIVTLTLGLK